MGRALALTLVAGMALCAAMGLLLAGPGRLLPLLLPRRAKHHAAPVTPVWPDAFEVRAWLSAALAGEVAVLSTHARMQDRMHWTAACRVVRARALAVP